MQPDCHNPAPNSTESRAAAHLALCIGAGRTAQDRQHAGELIFAAATTALAPLFARPHFALTLEISEIDPDFSWKMNCIHRRLCAQ